MKATKWVCVAVLAATGVGVNLLASGPAFADALGSVKIVACSSGSITISLTAFTWSPTGTVAGTGCMDTTGGTSLTYSGGALGVGDAGNIKNLFAGGGAVDQFMTFQGTSLDFVLTVLGQGVSNTNCTGLATNGTCTPVAGSPLILTNLGGGTTSITFDAGGTVLDGGVTENWSGLFTILDTTDTAAAIQKDILEMSSVSGQYSASFTSGPATATPEPGTTALLLVGLGSLALVSLRKRKVGFSAARV